jgi:hypothetical protein
MSTLKADTVTTKTDDTDLTLTGEGTGVPNLEAGFKVGGTAGVPAASIQDDAITSAKIADDAVVTAAIADDAITAALMADDAVGVAQLSATGTASGSTFLRGDNAWAEAGGGKIGQVISSSVSAYATHANVNIDAPVEILTATITPSASSSKILIHALSTGSSTSSDVQMFGINLYRDSTAIGLGDKATWNSGVGECTTSNTVSYSKPNQCRAQWIDSPSSTSAITYRMKCFVNHWGSSLSNLTFVTNGGGYSYNNKETAIGSCSFIVMEILA